MSEAQREYVVDLSNVLIGSSEGLDCFAWLQGLPVLEPITRCKDCKHYNDGIVNGRYIREPCCEEIGELSFGASYTVDENDFCSRAERREE